MGEDLNLKFSKSDPNKLDLILLTLQRLQEDLHLTKCQIQTAVREVALRQGYITDWMAKLQGNFSQVNERLHGLELNQERQNSST